MANSIYGINNIYGVSNYYKSYLNNNYNRTNSLSSILYSAVASNANTLANRSQSASTSYLSQLNNSINSMYMANSTLALSNKTVTSANNASISGTAQINAAVKNYSAKVSKLAAGQVNMGTGLAAGDKSILNKGQNTFKFKSGTTERTLSLLINENDTNKTALNKLSTAINKSGTGIKASVETNSNDTVYLKLESTRTGTRNSFILEDRQGNAVAAAGLGKVESKAQDAVYSIDGRQFTSSANTVSLDHGKVQVTLKKADNTEIELKVAPDAAGSTVPNFYTYYNNLLSSGNYYNTSLSNGNLLDMLL